MQLFLLNCFFLCPWFRLCTLYVLHKWLYKPEITSTKPKVIMIWQAFREHFIQCLKKQVFMHTGWQTTNNHLYNTYNCKSLGYLVVWKKPQQRPECGPKKQIQSQQFFQYIELSSMHVGNIKDACSNIAYKYMYTSYLLTLFVHIYVQIECSLGIIRLVLPIASVHCDGVSLRVRLYAWNRACYWSQ